MIGRLSVSFGLRGLGISWLCRIDTRLARVMRLDRKVLGDGLVSNVLALMSLHRMGRGGTWSEMENRSLVLIVVS